MGKRFVGIFLFSASNPNRRGTPSVWVMFVAWYDAMLLTGHDRGVVATLFDRTWKLHGVTGLSDIMAGGQ
jgi:hypothetical protein